MAFFTRTKEPFIDEKRGKERRSYGEIMGTFVTVKQELVELVKEKTGHVTRLDRDGAEDQKQFEARKAKREMERQLASSELSDAQESIDFIEKFVKTPKVVAQQ